MIGGTTGVNSCNYAENVIAAMEPAVNCTGGNTSAAQQRVYPLTLPQWSPPVIGGTTGWERDLGLVGA